MLPELMFPIMVNPLRSRVMLCEIVMGFVTVMFARMVMVSPSSAASRASSKDVYRLSGSSPTWIAPFTVYEPSSPDASIAPLAMYDSKSSFSSEIPVYVPPEMKLVKFSTWTLPLNSPPSTDRVIFASASALSSWLFASYNASAPVNVPPVMTVVRASSVVWGTMAIAAPFVVPPLEFASDERAAPVAMKSPPEILTVPARISRAVCPVIVPPVIVRLPWYAGK